MRVVVCVGSNCGCRRKNVEDAVAWLGTQLEELRRRLMLLSWSRDE